jgi:hypothetical protein
MGELVGDKSGRVEVELYGEIDAVDLMEIVEQPPARPAPEDEALDEARAEQDEGEQRETRGRGVQPVRWWMPRP